MNVEVAQKILWLTYSFVFVKMFVVNLYIFMVGKENIVISKGGTIMNLSLDFKVVAVSLFPNISFEHTLTIRGWPNYNFLVKKQRTLLVKPIKLKGLRTVTGDE